LLVACGGDSSPSSGSGDGVSITSSGALPAATVVDRGLDLPPTPTPTEAPPATATPLPPPPPTALSPPVVAAASTAPVSFAAMPGTDDEPMATAVSAAVAATTGGSVSLKDIARTAAREAERELILRMLTRTRWNRKEAAEILGISYKALLYKIKENGLDKAS
jgi:DNA-binding protein Fis